MIECPEVEKEVKRLLRADTFAVNVCILLAICWSSVTCCALVGGGGGGGEGEGTAPSGSTRHEIV